MTACGECDAEMSERRQAIAYADSLVPDVILVGITVRTCACGHEETDLPQLDELHALILKLRPKRGGALRLAFRDDAWREA